MNKPNVLFIFSDQHRFCDIGCYGNTEISTPNLDKLASKSAVMERFYSNCPVCVPARGTLLTGLYPLNHKAITNDLEIDSQVESIADVWNLAGYTTGYVGKWHLGGVPRQKAIDADKRLGFKYWRGCNCNHDYLNAWYDDDENNRHFIDGYEPVAQTNLALDFIEREEKSESPWALVISYGTPHEPYNLAPKPLIDKYINDNLSLRKNVITPAKLNESTSISEEKLKDWYAGYYAHITALDEQIGRLIVYLEESKLIKNTIIVYTSDHGDMLGSHGLTNKQWPYEESSHIPFMLMYDGIVPPGRRSQLMSLVDVAPTIAGLSDLSFKHKLDGVNRKSIFISPDSKGADCVYMLDPIPCHQAYDRNSSEWRAVINQQFMYARTPYDSGWLLYDIELDPLQTNNLINNPKYKKTQEKLDGLLLKMAQENDADICWDEWIYKFGLLKQWNSSQKYFNYPLLPEK